MRTWNEIHTLHYLQLPFYQLLTTLSGRKCTLLLPVQFLSYYTFDVYMYMYSVRSSYCGGKFNEHVPYERCVPWPKMVLA